MEEFENYSTPCIRCSRIQRILVVDEVVVGQMLMEEFESDSCPYDRDSNIQLIVVVDDVVAGQMLKELSSYSLK